MTSPTRTREIHLASRPSGWPTPDNFRTVEVELPAPGSGEVLVRNTVMSVDPYMRGRMNDVKSYVPPFRLDAPLEGGAVGEVLASGDGHVPVGATVLHQAGWREHALLPAKHVRVLDTSLAPATAYLGVLGMPGLTAYVGLTRIAPVKEGDTVFVSGAAGAVGSVAGQIARLRGAARVVGSAGSAAKVVGSAGSEEKVRWLTEELGFDVAFNYKDAKVVKQLAEHAPVDVYFDNVGGDHLEAAIEVFNRDGRAALCGAISTYNATEPPPGPRNLFQLVAKGLTLKGFIVSWYAAEHGPAFAAEVGDWLRSGQLTYDETVVQGLDRTVDAFLGMLRGDNTGKMVVAV